MALVLVNFAVQLLTGCGGRKTAPGEKGVAASGYDGNTVTGCLSRAALCLHAVFAAPAALAGRMN